MKRIASFVLILVMILFFCSCGHEHDWQPATCTQPKTCSKCGETLGEPLGHFWQEAECGEPMVCATCGAVSDVINEHEWMDATCEQPKTCSKCGATEGKALGHDFEKPNYQQPAICKVCGKSEGARLEPEMIKYGLENNIVSMTSDFISVGQYTTDSKYSSKKVDAYTTAEWAVACDSKTNYSSVLNNFYIPSNQTAVKFENYDSDVYNLSPIDGYEWRGIHVKAPFYSTPHVVVGFVDFYSLQNYDENSTINRYYTWNDFSIEYNGKSYSDCAMFAYGRHGNHNYDEYVFYRVPAGYDGCTVCLINSNNKDNTNGHIDTSKNIIDVLGPDAIILRLD